MPKSNADPTVTPELVAEHGLTPEEFERIKKILRREPNFTELGIFSVMWSEHCSYKNKEGPTARRNPQDRHSQIAANRRLFTGVVSGIAHYGNCVGVPTIGGEIYFDESFEGNPLVNVFCLGVLRHEQLARGAARGVGHHIF